MLRLADDVSNHLSTAASLRQLQLVLRKLEQEIAAVKVSAEKGFTAPGSFLFNIFDRWVLVFGWSRVVCL